MPIRQTRKSWEEMAWPSQAANLIDTDHTTHMQLPTCSCPHVPCLFQDLASCGHKYWDKEADKSPQQLSANLLGIEFLIFDSKQYCGFGESCKKSERQILHMHDFSHSKINGNFRACAKFDVQIFCKIPQNRSTMQWRILGKCLQLWKCIEVSTEE